MSDIKVYMFASYGMFASPSGAVATGGDSQGSGSNADNDNNNNGNSNNDNDMPIIITIILLIAPILAKPRETEGRDLNIHCARSPTLVKPHSLVELAGFLVLAFFIYIYVYIYKHIHLHIGTTTTTTEHPDINILVTMLKNKASIVADLPKGLLEHREAPLLCLIQSLFGLLWRGSYISQVTC